MTNDKLLPDLQKLLPRLEEDLRARHEEMPEIAAALRAEYAQAKEQERTGQSYEEWLSGYATQVAAAWVLTAVFARFLEDNRLVDPPRLAGPGERLTRARDEHEAYFRDHPRETDREFLLDVFRELARLPGCGALFGNRLVTGHWSLVIGEEANSTNDQGLMTNDSSANDPGAAGWLGPDAAGELLRFFQRIDAETGELAHDFTDEAWDTRFLGDLYQDLSEAARKKYALLQTPEFIEEFILDRTLEPALDEYGLGKSLVTGHWSLAKKAGSSTNDQGLMTNDAGAAGLGKSLAKKAGSSTNDQGPVTNDLFRMIDPACGSGHFLLGAFERILDRWQKQEPGTSERELVQRTLDSIHGVDVNPYAVAIARFRLLLAALRACGVTRLADAPAFEMNLACGDSLYHGAGRQQHLGDWTDEAHFFQTEDAEQLRRILVPGSFHCVVANPPYITPKDKAANNAYRKLYAACHMKYSLAVPFMERCFGLAKRGSLVTGHWSLAKKREESPRRTNDQGLMTNDARAGSLVTGHLSLAKKKEESPPRTNDQGLMTNDAREAGYVGQITANSFMKREFGKKLIEEFFPGVDLTHVIDTSGAYIPGHGTPTVILLGRNRPPLADTLRTVMGIRGEPATPDDPARGQVWTAILDQIDRPGSESEFVSAGDSPRELFHQHPWSIGGGGAAELKERLERTVELELNDVADSIGITSFTLEDEIFILPLEAAQRSRITRNSLRPMVVGDAVRDWTVGPSEAAVFPYDGDFEAIAARPDEAWFRYLWPARTCLANNKMFGGKTKVETGLKWYEYGRLTSDKLRTPLSIVFAFVATHNHFVLDRGGKVFNRSAPVIKLPEGTSEDDHLALLGLLNSSTACFWMKQILTGKHKGDGGAAHADPAYQRFEFDATKLRTFPLPADRPLKLAKLIDELASSYAELLPSAITALGPPTRRTLEMAKLRADVTRGQMVALQEELDWECYRLYGLTAEEESLVTGHWSLVKKEEHAPLRTNDQGLMTNDPLPNDPLPNDPLPNDPLPNDQGLMTNDFFASELLPGQRAFEIVLARKMARGEIQTTWFKRHGMAPVTELPADWPEGYKRVVERRIELIETDKNIALIEQPEHKRRWSTEPWESQVERALRQWLLDKLESFFDFDGRMKKSLVTGHWSLAEKESLVAGHSSLGKKENSSTNDQGLVTNDPLPNDLFEIQLVSVAQLADVAATDESFLQVGALYRDDSAFDVVALVEELVAAEHVPLLPVLRYKPSGLRKRAQWETTWELQREEDKKKSLVTGHWSLVKKEGSAANDQGLMTNDPLPNDSLANDQGLMTNDPLANDQGLMTNDSPPVPPKYKSSDFIATGGARYWALRGKLDVPKERWISFPHCEGEDASLVICWAGYDHLQQARAIAAHYVDVQERLGGAGDPRLAPLLACLIELLPWLAQWHNDPDPAYDGLRMGDYYAGFVAEEATRHGTTLETLRAWTPPPRTGRRGRRKMKS